MSENVATKIVSFHGQRLCSQFSNYKFLCANYHVASACCHRSKIKQASKLFWEQDKHTTLYNKN